MGIVLMGYYKKNLGNHWYIKKQGKKWWLRPFATIQTASADLIWILAEKYNTINEIYNNINYDNEAKNVIKYLIDKGYGNSDLKKICNRIS